MWTPNENLVYTTEEKQYMNYVSRLFLKTMQENKKMQS